MSDKRQKIQLKLAFMARDKGEARRTACKGAEPFTAKCQTEGPDINERLMEEACEWRNCRQALVRVRANKGSPGVDGMTVDELPGYLQHHWP